nr:B12-binding domain-containing radical SAM protein [uncultured Acetatifactor sp.]
MDFKFLLAAVNAKYIHSNPAVYSLRACAGEALGRHVELAEYTINQPVTEILADIYGRRPDIIGFSCYIWNWRLVRELLGEIPKLLPDTEIWLGGPEVSYDADVILREHPQVAGIMVGEGEITFRELLEYYAENKAPAGSHGTESESMAPAGHEDMEPKAIAVERLQRIPGLCLPTGYTVCRPLTDLSAIPFPYDDLSPFGNRILYYESSRGCPFRCSYCLSSIDKQVRIRDIRKVKAELQFFLDHRVKQVKFIDRTFNCSHAHTTAVWSYLLEHDNGVTNFHFEITADILRQDETELLNRFRPGLAQLEIGVQTMNPRTLKAIRRTMDTERLESAVAAIHKGENVHLHLDLIAGLPYEDYESFGMSFDRVCRMRPHQLQLGFLKVLKGSEMWERAAEYGIRYLEQPPYEVLCTKWLSYEEVLRLKRIEEMVELYYNSAQFTHTLPVLEKAFHSPFALYETLADFYEKKGYFTASPARAYRYQVLLEFAVAYDGNRKEIYAELLTYDMYLRENLKTRPDFAQDTDQYREEIRAFYQMEEKERRYLPDYKEYDWKQLSRMTHLEPFAYPVWDRSLMAEECESKGRSGGCFLVLFDYRRRDPLTCEATVQTVN